MTHSELHGVVLIDKPSGLTSQDVCRQLRKVTGQRSVGHAGTLDPLATGLLVVGFGKGTKLLTWLSADRKAYDATIRLGAASSTYDREGVVDPDMVPVPEINEGEIRPVLEHFRGEIEQQVPAYSAVRVDGARLHEQARSGHDVNPPVRTVTIHNLTVTDYQPPFVSISTVVSKGTYIRSLAHDIGQRLGCGAWLDALRRTASGHLSIDDAVALDALANRSAVEQILRPLASVLPYPSVTVTDTGREFVRVGRIPDPTQLVSLPQQLDDGDLIQLLDGQGHLLAVARATGWPLPDASKDLGPIAELERVLA